MKVGYHSATLILSPSSCVLIRLGIIGLNTMEGEVDRHHGLPDPEASKSSGELQSYLALCTYQTSNHVAEKHG
jgi:hypothetical protein